MTDLVVGAVRVSGRRAPILVREEDLHIMKNDGPVLVDVPNVVGQQLDQARQALEAAGFKVTVRKALGGFFGDFPLIRAALFEREPASQMT